MTKSTPIILMIKAFEVEGEVEETKFASPYDQLWAETYEKWYGCANQKNGQSVIERLTDGQITEQQAKDELIQFQRNYKPTWKRISGTSKLVSIHDNPHTRGEAIYEVSYPGFPENGLLETCREYFGDSRTGFTYGSIARWAFDNLTRTEIAIEDRLGYDAPKGAELAELRAQGYDRRAHNMPGCNLPDNVHREWETPTVIVRTYKEYVSVPVSEAGGDWGGESEDYRKCEVYLKPYNNATN